MAGVKLSDLRKKKSVTLPKSGAVVEVWDDVLAGEVLGGMQFDAKGQVGNANMFAVILSLIADWNFIDDDGEKLPINEENIKKLPITDFNVLAEQLQKVTENSAISETVKKNT